MGVPLIVKTPAAKDPVTPAGKPTTPAPVPLPVTAYVIDVIGVLIHTVWLFVPGAEVRVITAFGLTVRRAPGEKNVHPPWPGGVIIFTR